jgi:type IV pilus assembly protein PilM
MFDKPTATSVLGLECAGNRLRAALLYLDKGKPALSRLVEIPISLSTSMQEQVNPLYMSDEGNSLRGKLDKNLIVTVLDGSQVLVRPLDIKLKKEKDVEAVIPFQAEPLLPYPLENALLDTMSLSQHGEGTHMTLLAGRKDHLQQHLIFWQTFQIEPEVVSALPTALLFFSKLIIPSDAPHYIVHLGATQTTCVVVKQGQLIASQSIDIGCQKLVEAYRQDLKLEEGQTGGTLSQIDFSHIVEKQQPALHQAIVNWRREILRLFYALEKQAKEGPITDVLLSGDGVAYPHLGNLLLKESHKHFVSPWEPPHFSCSMEQLQLYAVPIGAALSALPNGNEDQVNFRQGEFEYPRPWKRLKKPLGIYASLCLFLAFSAYVCGQAYSSYKENELRKEYVSLIGLMNKSYSAVEKEYRAKAPYPESIDDKEIPLSMLKGKDLLQRLQFLRLLLKEAPSTFPLQPNVPLVSDVLAWLSMHPSVRGSQEQEGKGPLPSPLEIETFHYTMVKRPEIKKPQEKYQVKVEIEFTSPTPKLAREFHDALIAPNDFVDAKGEVKWSSNKGKYRASFFLKDKTVYPGG